MPEHRGRIDTIRLVGGNICLDFVNTANGRRTSDSLGAIEENLCLPRDVVIWARRAEMMGSEAERALHALIEVDGHRAAAQLASLVAFRDRLHGLLKATADGQQDPQGIQELNEMLARTSRHRYLEHSDGQFRWSWHLNATTDSFFDSLLGQVAFAAADLLTCDNLERMRVCSSPDCDWLFLDTSKAGRRRWCQMDVCGNRAKARRHAGHAGH
ncbi:CGNR zinc finger domain-containing protein [Burkholderia plantarii]|uniref:CGNR zinc finger domain-containing protein n=1 Tax=Burkholderia plantarii TaxID=41899 RepID=UPI0014958365|nr:ABATE domain-containing protein [Burkholderia plantarii]